VRLLRRLGNPIASEAAAFRWVLFVLAVMVVLTLLTLLARAVV
jgi:hypothetical protein